MLNVPEWDQLCPRMKTEKRSIPSLQHSACFLRFGYKLERKDYNLLCIILKTRPHASQGYLDVPQLENKTETIELLAFGDPPWAVKLLLCLPHFLHLVHRHSTPSHHLQSYADVRWNLGLSGPAQHKDREPICQADSSYSCAVSLKKDQEHLQVASPARVLEYFIEMSSSVSRKYRYHSNGH